MKAFLKGFVYAVNGVRVVIWEERNMRFHICAAALVFYLARFYAFGPVQYAILAMLVGGVFALEMLNSMTERLIDALWQERNRTAGLIKDMAAGAVLVFSAAAAVCGVLLFWNRQVFAAIGAHYTQNVVELVLVGLFIAFAAWFVLCFGKKKEN